MDDHLRQPPYQAIAATPDLPRWPWSNVITVVIIAIGLIAFAWIVVSA